MSESNCVHCHEPDYLPQMLAFPDTRALARLIGPANRMFPGHLERSRILQDVTHADAQPAAMPSSRQAISKAEVGKLRAWIAVEYGCRSVRRSGLSPAVKVRARAEVP